MAVQNQQTQRQYIDPQDEEEQNENRNSDQKTFSDSTQEEPVSTTPEPVARTAEGMDTEADITTYSASTRQMTPPGAEETVDIGDEGGDRELTGVGPLTDLIDATVDLYLAVYGDELDPQLKAGLLAGDAQNDFIDGFEAGFVLGFGGSLEHTHNLGSIANPDDAFNIDMNEEEYGIGGSAVDGWNAALDMALLFDTFLYPGGNGTPIPYDGSMISAIHSELQAFSDDPMSYIANFLETTDEEILTNAGISDTDVQFLENEQQRILNDNVTYPTQEAKDHALMGVLIGAGSLIVGVAVGFGVAVALQSAFDADVEVLTEALGLDGVGQSLLRGESVADAAPEVVNEALNKFGINPELVGEGKPFATPQEAVANFKAARAKAKTQIPPGTEFNETHFRDYYKTKVDALGAEPVVGSTGGDPLTGNPLAGGSGTSDEISTQIANDYINDTYVDDGQVVVDAEVQETLPHLSANGGSVWYEAQTPIAVEKGQTFQNEEFFKIPLKVTDDGNVVLANKPDVVVGEAFLGESDELAIVNKIDLNKVLYNVQIGIDSEGNVLADIGLNLPEGEEKWNKIGELDPSSTASKPVYNFGSTSGEPPVYTPKYKVNAAELKLPHSMPGYTPHVPNMAAIETFSSGDLYAPNSDGTFSPPKPFEDAKVTVNGKGRIVSVDNPEYIVGYLEYDETGHLTTVYDTDKLLSHANVSTKQIGTSNQGVPQYAIYSTFGADEPYVIGFEQNGTYYIGDRKVYAGSELQLLPGQPGYHPSYHPHAVEYSFGVNYDHTKPLP